MKEAAEQRDHGPSTWRWDIDIAGMVDSFVHLETRDGSVREGRITAVKTEDVVVNGERYRIPLAFELNRDVQDLIEFRQIKQMTLR